MCVEGVCVPLKIWVWKEPRQTRFSTPQSSGESQSNMQIWTNPPEASHRSRRTVAPLFHQGRSRSWGRCCYDQSLQQRAHRCLMNKEKKTNGKMHHMRGEEAGDALSSCSAAETQNKLEGVMHICPVSLNERLNHSDRADADLRGIAPLIQKLLFSFTLAVTWPPRPP